MFQWLWRQLRARMNPAAPPQQAADPPQQAPNLPALPISSPLTSLGQLMDGSLFSSFQFPFQRSSVPLLVRATERGSKLLVCHDMKGGYQDDRFVQGDGNYNAYSLWHWQCINVFVYFSHSLVTIPPPCWINAAHRHGVQVLGTFITEWETGGETCKQLLESESSAKMYALRLAKVAQKFGFDGWLLNIENKIPVNLIDNLVVFISELSKSMHELVPTSLVIWYDAVTVDGALNWQDKLTEKNKRFFDACDGIFINYTWKEGYAEKSATLAGNRATDVYMGVDVFGRNTFGGGGFQSDVALKAALKAGVSAALFAPGWVYEKNIGPSFEEAQIKFWASIHNVWPLAHKSPIALPFYSEFNQGFGKNIYIDGEQVSNSPWSDISCQTVQPLLSGVIDPNFEVCVRSVDPVYSGGSSLRFLGKLNSSGFRIAKLYASHILLTKPSLFIDHSVLPKNNSVFTLVLKIQNVRGQILVVFLDETAKQGSTLKPDRKISKSSSAAWSVSSFEIRVEPGSVLMDIYGLINLASSSVDLKEIAELVSVEKRPDLLSDRKLLLDSYEVHLGHLRITDDCPATSACSPKVSSFRAEDLKFDGKVISLTLRWQFGDGFQAHGCSVYVEGIEVTEAKFLGVAFVDAFYVDSLAVPQSSSQLVFRLRPRNAAGYYLKPDAMLVEIIR